MNDINALEEELKEQSEKLSYRLMEYKEFAKTVTLKIRYANFLTYTRAKTLKNPTNKTEEILTAAMESFRNLKKKDEVRLIGIQLSSITKSNIVQLTFKDMENITEATVPE